MSKVADLPQLKPQWFQILLALADRDLHGYAIMSDVLERTRGRMRLWPGMLYGSLKRMVEAELIEEIDDPLGSPPDKKERRFYSMTKPGKQALAAEARRLAEYVEVARGKNVFSDGEPV